MPRLTYGFYLLILPLLLNTMKPLILAQSLASEFLQDRDLILWMMDFVSQRVQTVKVGTYYEHSIPTRLCSIPPFSFFYTLTAALAHNQADTLLNMLMIDSGA